jgi:hypothetical protein
MNDGSKNKTKEAILREKELYKSLMFVRKLDIDLEEHEGESEYINNLKKGTIIWNEKHKEMYEKIEAESRAMKQMCIGKQKNKDKFDKINLPKKPRPG